MIIPDHFSNYQEKIAKRRENEKVKEINISLSNAFPSPRTMMIKPHHANIAILTMQHVLRRDDIAADAKASLIAKYSMYIYI